MHLKTRLLSALETLSQIRMDILQRAKIRTMPPVAVQCKLRKLDDGMVSGTMLPMPYEKGKVFGVTLLAHTALCYDTTVIRSSARIQSRFFKDAARPGVDVSWGGQHERRVQ